VHGNRFNIIHAYFGTNVLQILRQINSYYPYPLVSNAANATNVPNSKNAKNANNGTNGTNDLNSMNATNATSETNATESVINETERLLDYLRFSGGITV
jgi:hypothetical protein